jgi:hypothetical protein
MSLSTPIIAIPAGKCPSKLESTEYEQVISWCVEVHAIGIKNNVNYLPSALVFFAQQFFDIFGEEYKTVKNHINKAYNAGDDGKLQEFITKANYEKLEIEKQKAERMEAARKLEEQVAIRKAQEKLERPAFIEKTPDKPIEQLKKKRGRPPKRK